ncbi:MAG: hypothetical protein JWL70_452, partial [Acidimicrobiia bacterium]|nr:hypothetical protein [Acidimicrobiia bacterium]
PVQEPRRAGRKAHRLALGETASVPAFETQRVAEVLSVRAGLQRVLLDSGQRAYVLADVIGSVAVGDDVVVNTTAVDLALGTGGWHVVHWNLARTEWKQAGPGHIMKARYTSGQIDAGSVEEVIGELPVHLGGLPVIVGSLHSQLAAIAVAYADAAPGARLAYVMTDGGALPMVISELVTELVSRGLLATTITAGQAFGGEHEAVGIADALALASTLADAVVVTMGPGGVGTGTRMGATALEVAPILWTAQQLGGRPVAALRVSGADPRPRHQGLSHHWQTALGVLRAPGAVGVPKDAPAELLLHIRQLLVDDSRVISVDVPDPVDRFAQLGLAVSSMGRPAAADPVLFQWAAASAVVAASWASSVQCP